MLGRKRWIVKNGGDRGQSRIINRACTYPFLSWNYHWRVPVLGRNQKIHVSANMDRITGPVDESDRVQVVDTRFLSCFVLSFIIIIEFLLEGRGRRKDDDGSKGTEYVANCILHREIEIRRIFNQANKIHGEKENNLAPLWTNFH